MLPSQSLLSSEDSFVNVNLCETFITVSLNKFSHVVWKAVCVL